MRNKGLFFFAIVSIALAGNVQSQQSDLTADRVRQSLAKATTFMHSKIADHGGYAYVSSADGRYSNGEGVAGPNRVWVQPPGTPAVAMAMLKAYRATGDRVHLAAAQDAGQALVQGQLRSGGWYYSIEFDPKLRARIPYRVGPNGGVDKIIKTKPPGGWQAWRTSKHKTNKTLIDDDTTPAAIRFLAELDRELDFKNKPIHDTAIYALRSTLNAQYPIGAWGHNYDRFPPSPASTSYYPILRASFPDDYPRKWPNAWNGCYGINDRITTNMIKTMLLAGKVYKNDRLTQSAILGGDFLLNAQLPEPQPAWAQQYNEKMHPVWERKFEPPAITGLESQDVIESLLHLYRETKQPRFLKPIPKALNYLKESLRSDERLARYYELQTNRPLYFNKDYELTTDDSKMPDHYAFVVDSRLDELSREYAKLKSGDFSLGKPSPETLTKNALAAIQSQRADGAWLTKTFVRDENARKVVPPEGVIESQVFIDHLESLVEWLEHNPGR